MNSGGRDCAIAPLSQFISYIAEAQFYGLRLAGLVILARLIYL